MFSPFVFVFSSKKNPVVQFFCTWRFEFFGK